MEKSRLVSTSILSLFFLLGCQSQPPAVDEYEHIEFASDIDELSESALAELNSLTASLSRLVADLDYDGRPILVRYLGVGEVVDEIDVQDAEMSRDVLEEEFEEEVEDAGALSNDSEWIAVSLSSGNEFRVTYPLEVFDGASERASRLEIDRGVPVRPGDDVSEESELFDVAGDDSVAYGWSRGNDNREQKGTRGVAHTHAAYRRLVQIGTGCSGTLVGPKHILTAAHCVRDFANRRWFRPTLRAGRSRSAWRASVGAQSNTWFWAPARFMQVADGRSSMPSSAISVDIGMYVTHNGRMGDVVDWMGWWRHPDDATVASRTAWNRGYPACGFSASPSDSSGNCWQNALYGDRSSCSIASFSARDSDGYNRIFRHGCDTSPAQSGSSLYSYASLFGGTYQVIGVHSSAACQRCSSGDVRPNYAVRITDEYAGAISSLRAMFP